MWGRFLSRGTQGPFRKGSHKVPAALRSLAFHYKVRSGSGFSVSVLAGVGLTAGAAGVAAFCYSKWGAGGRGPFVLFADDDKGKGDFFAPGLDEFIQQRLEKFQRSLDEILKEDKKPEVTEISPKSGNLEPVPESVVPVEPIDVGDEELLEAEPEIFEPEEDAAIFDWGQFCEIIAPHWKLLTVAVGSALAVAVINIEIPHLLGQMVDIVTRKIISLPGDGEPDFKFLVRTPAMKLIGMYVLQAGCTFTYIYSLSIVGEEVATTLRKRLFASMLNQDIVFFDTHMTGEIVSRLTSDIQEFKSSFKQCISQGLRSVSQLLGCVISLYMISPEMTRTIVIIVPLIITIGSVFGRGLRTLSKRAQEQVSKSSGHAEETLANIRTVRAFAMENEELERYSGDVDKAKKLNIELGAGIGVFQAGSNMFLNGIVLAVLYTGGSLITSHTISSGDLMSFLVAAQTIQRSLSNLSLLFGQAVRGLGAGGRVFEYINLPTNYDLTAGKQILLADRLRKVKGDVEFHNVWFRYPTRTGEYVLKRFSLQVPRGKVVAVVGPSGSGKSTLVNLLEGFYPVEKGEITIDGYRTDMLDPNWLRGEVFGLINQEPVLFASSIMDNIRYGKPEATDEEVYEAARNANAYNFIKEFPEGFQTLLGERGVTVSGGQKQRIAIARALIKNPAVLILDEATSALDTESEKIVQETLDAVSKGRTVLVIAHRLSTIQNADLIAVVANGRVAELGTHTQLKQQKGLYYNLVKQQEYKARTQKPKPS